jgi:hypothetical protein
MADYSGVQYSNAQRNALPKGASAVPSCRRCSRNLAQARVIVAADTPYCPAMLPASRPRPFGQPKNSVDGDNRSDRGQRLEIVARLMVIRRPVPACRVEVGIRAAVAMMSSAGHIVNRARIEFSRRDPPTIGIA